MKVRELRALLQMSRGMDPLVLEILAEKDTYKDFMDKAIRAVAMGEIEWREQCRMN
jgi:hypothetical protein